MTNRKQELFIKLLGKRAAKEVMDYIKELKRRGYFIRINFNFNSSDGKCFLWWWAEKIDNGLCLDYVDSGKYDEKNKGRCYSVKSFLVNLRKGMVDIVSRDE